MPEEVQQTNAGLSVDRGTIIVVPSHDRRHELLQVSQLAAIAALLSVDPTQEA